MSVKFFVYAARYDLASNSATASNVSYGEILEGNSSRVNASSTISPGSSASGLAGAGISAANTTAQQTTENATTISVTNNQPVIATNTTTETPEFNVTASILNTTQTNLTAVLSENGSLSTVEISSNETTTLASPTMLNETELQTTLNESLLEHGVTTAAPFSTTPTRNCSTSLKFDATIVHPDTQMTAPQLVLEDVPSATRCANECYNRPGCEAYEEENYTEQTEAYTPESVIDGGVIAPPGGKYSSSLGLLCQENGNKTLKFKATIATNLDEFTSVVNTTTSTASDCALECYKVGCKAALFIPLADVSWGECRFAFEDYKADCPSYVSRVTSFQSPQPSIISCLVCDATAINEVIETANETTTETSITNKTTNNLTSISEPKIVRACHKQLLYKVIFDTKLDQSPKWTSNATSVDQCAQLCYSRACSSAFFDPAQEKCALSFGSFPECPVDLNGRLLGYNGTNSSWVQCIVCKQFTNATSATTSAAISVSSNETTANQTTTVVTTAAPTNETTTQTVASNETTVVSAVGISVTVKKSSNLCEKYLAC
uniref:Apple domain-containing protein n=1 Tax=Romanomermis culicivorax TaxID=13658 RepID=A0A915HZ70_ROMCU